MTPAYRQPKKATTNSSEGGYRSRARSPGEWNSYSQVGADVFSDVSIKGYTPAANSAAANAGAQADGVFFDYYGNPRPASGPISAGAVEV